MTDEFDRRLGVWRIVYQHIPIQGRYSSLPRVEQIKHRSIEERLRLKMFAEANQVIAMIKRKLDH